jgi:oligopeptide/dipeptide ABC transporter ATP-binding protein
MALLRVEDLVVEYATPKGPLRAVDGVSIEIGERGQALGIIGESGSGKTSLAIALMRILPRNGRLAGGRVLLEGRDLLALDDDTFRREIRWQGMAMVFQGAMHALNPVIRVGQQVAERLIVDGHTKREALAEAERLLERVGLSRGTSARYPHELSGGMKQRVVIAMALTHSPPLLLLDEPTSALDVSVQAQIMNLLKELKADLGISMLFITHDLALASDLCDRVAVMYAGEVREVGPTDDVLRDPRDPYTQRLIASIPVLHGTAPPAFLPGVPPDLREPIAGCRFASRCPYAIERSHLEPPPLRAVAPGRMARCWLDELPALMGPPASEPSGARGGPEAAVGTSREPGPGPDR